ncbi:phosphodiester glycosidase family protein [Armatimonas sp.]|uniref:phosphodiester glycosidase family protein n=1 Tax=Armatimonas sp. TaxID=1872638 RepID=UPI00286C0D25|nr:phosphodiester glycosidase family protein [Armatimonas sp.]
MGKITQTLFALAGLAALANSASAAAPVRLQTRVFGGKTVHFVRVNLDSDSVLVQPMIAKGGVGSSESLASMANRGAKVVLTGAFFDTRSLQPMGDIVIGKKLLHFGGRGAALCLRRVRDGEGWVADIRANDGIDRHTDWGKSEVVLAGGIRLLAEGEIVVNPRKSGFSPLLEKPDPRAGVGIMPNGDLILVATKSAVSLTEWAQIFKSVGAVEALNYDGGSSTGLYMDGKALVAPGRKLTNALAVYVEQDRPESTKVSKAGTRRKPVVVAKK